VNFGDEVVTRVNIRAKALIVNIAITETRFGLPTPAITLLGRLPELVRLAEAGTVLATATAH